MDPKYTITLLVCLIICLILLILVLLLSISFVFIIKFNLKNKSPKQEVVLDSIPFVKNNKVDGNLDLSKEETESVFEGNKVEQIINKLNEEEQKELLNKLLVNKNIENNVQSLVDKILEPEVTKFDSNSIDKDLVDLSENPIALSEFLLKINSLVDKDKYKALSIRTVVAWLIKNNYINENKIQVIKEVVKYSATEKGKEIGILEDNEVDSKTGETYPSYLLSKKAQSYLLDNLDNICMKKVVKENNRWTEEEQKQLIDEFVYKNMSVAEIAKIHNRTEVAIDSRLKKVGLIEHEKPRKSELKVDDFTDTFILREKLRKCRLDLMKREGYAKAYKIFNNITLDELVDQRPCTLLDLEKIEGLGQVKISKYGQDIIDCIIDHINER